ncbi:MULTISPECIES: alpha/beta fold hydrolase [unclassified Nocardioides]|uniref:alpha/beta fold hydrolase n=1 Tax=unclassified Nocardioides TaxID=2615069 RepID=UPI0009EADDF3|nr:MULTISPECIES: alpha/beta fold hydrolase [unclassified Nocardioides]
MGRLAGVAVVAVLLLTGCTSEAPTAEPAPTASGPPSAAPSSGPTQPPTPAERGESLPPRTDTPSLANLMRADFDGRGLRVLRTETRTDAYTRQQVTYRSNGTLVSGVLLRPHGGGPFPAVVLNHGYIEPSAYVTGQGMAREQDWLARAGFVVLHTDYRGHAAGDPAGDRERELRLAYTRDSINAVLALERLPYVDADKTAMVGRSMGGGVTLNALVAAPGLVDAAVIYASVSSRFLDNLEHFTRPNRPEAVAALASEFGTPEQSPGFYRGLSSRTYVDRITEPVLIHHGTVDATCPPRWSRTTHRLLERAGVDSTLVEYPGEDHAFYARWQDSIVRTVRFLRRHLDV